MYSYKNPDYNPMREDLGPSRFRAENLVGHMGAYEIYKRNQSYDVVKAGTLVGMKKSWTEAKEYCHLLGANQEK
ncbi:hypothetical protein GW579_04965 [Rahnella sp. Lac-M11]|jgi:hypothetical protein|uniref:Uncharacterized protein n=1 Tax=Rahnella contaminans TaxID=2703882 RepID=A0A6M2B1U1_9GAMM|nr:hypothetical protein [Rahnella contaminans]NGX86441.1 hypothetical protein [Rahnella contaminans]